MEKGDHKGPERVRSRFRSQVWSNCRRYLLPSVLVIGCVVQVVLVIWRHEGYQQINANKRPRIGELIKRKCANESTPAPFQCWDLYAPLDYSNASDERTARLAVATYPAGGGKTKKKDILGTILINWGGPGGQAFVQLPRTSPRYNGSTVAEGMDKQLNHRYNLLAWDPRGVGYTSPAANCLKWPEQGSTACDNALPRASSSGLSCLLQQDRAIAMLCADHATLTDELRFVTTADTVRDMRLLYRAAGDKLLRFWGFSYGTVIGSVFADMFPDEVGRLVLDGTVDVPNYMAGERTSRLFDVQAEYEKGYIGECERAGSKCGLNAVAAAEKKDIKTLLDDFEDRLIEEPMISVKTNSTLFTYTAYKEELYSAMYKTQYWPTLANATAQAIQGDPTLFMTEFIDGKNEKDLSPQGEQAISGADALNRRPWSLIDYKNLLGKEEKRTKTFGELSSGKSEIQSWQITGKNRWPGNYTAMTRNPILFIGNDYDPATPIAGARKMTTLFPNSSLLRNKMYGHCSSGQPSQCSLDTATDYFVNGTIPPRNMGKDGLVEPGKICDVDRQPWDDADGSLASSETLSSLLSDTIHSSQARRRRR